MLLIIESWWYRAGRDQVPLQGTGSGDFQSQLHRMGDVGADITEERTQEHRGLSRTSVTEITILMLPKYYLMSLLFFGSSQF